MKKLMKFMAAIFLLLLVTLTVTPAKVYADENMLVKNKTNKLTLADSMDECYRSIEESLAAGKSVSYKINVPKGVLYIRITDFTDFKVEIYDSENKVVKELESITNELYGDITLASGGVELNKGKYKIKISPKDKKSALNLTGIVAMLKTNTSRTLSLNKLYNIAVKKGETYKFKFKLKDTNIDSRLTFTNFIQSYDPDEFIPDMPEYKVVNSKGKTVKRVPAFTQGILSDLEDGTYTFILEAEKNGILVLEVSF